MIIQKFFPRTLFRGRIVFVTDTTFMIDGGSTLMDFGNMAEAFTEAMGGE